MWSPRSKSYECSVRPPLGRAFAYSSLIVRTVSDPPSPSGRQEWSEGESNSRPLRCERSALPAELSPRVIKFLIRCEPCGVRIGIILMIKSQSLPARATFARTHAAGCNKLKYTLQGVTSRKFENMCRAWGRVTLFLYGHGEASGCPCGSVGTSGGFSLGPWDEQPPRRLPVTAFAYRGMATKAFHDRRQSRYFHFVGFVRG